MVPGESSNKIASKASSSGGWWDRRFTRLLLEHIPAEARTLVDYRCGAAPAARHLLPELPQAEYIGVELDAEVLKQSKAQLAATPLAPRISLRLGEDTELPLPDAIADVALSVLGLQHCHDSLALLADTLRVLSPGGKLIAVEADNLGQRFYFDSVLEDLNQKLHTLCLRARVAQQPADIAIGPHLPSLIKRAGFDIVGVLPYTIGSTRLEPAKSFCDRVQRIISHVAGLAGMEEHDEEVKACTEAIRRFLFAGLPKRLGHSAHLVPAFLCAAKR